MKPIRHFFADARRHRGLALIIVLSMLALATIVILAFLSVAETEHKATTMYSSSQASRRFADMAVNMVIGQIRSGSERETPNVPVIHATQPGAVRKYAASGNFLAGYKLFSDQTMTYRAAGGGVNQAEMDFVRNSEPPQDWNQGVNTARYVDLNEPVIKGVAAGADLNREKPQIYFPIIDPRAGQDGDAQANTELPIEGFSYETMTALKGTDISGASAGVRSPPILKPSGATQGDNIDLLRLAMPVQWLYVLKDGAVGYLHDAGGQLQFRVLNQGQNGLGAGPSVSDGESYGVPSQANPIVGRVAFWTDDETSKVNINTASEPTFAGQPIYYHERDHRWADYPPARYEFQRFPGHPATVALSSILFPNPLQNDARSLDTYGAAGAATGAELSLALAAKERIYDIIPRINHGGSFSGTRTFSQDAYETSSGDKQNATAVNIIESMSERLYASVDELLFAQGNNGGRRIMNQVDVNNITLFNKTTLERASAFLTAHSRGSEINLFGLPRIAMWPLPRNTGGVSKRTGYDNLIEFCSRLGQDKGPDASNTYIFQRQHSQTLQGSVNGATFDISLKRNRDLLSMLDKILAQPFPTATHEGGATAKSFREKLGQDNARQLLVSMFDYIRCTNLYDSFLIPQNRSQWPSSSINWTTLYNLRDSMRGQFRTFTPGVVRDAGNSANPFADRFFPGHGQVTPAAHPDWKIGGGGAIRGFGRFMSVSEIGLQFICTADGQPDMYSWRLPIKDTSENAADNHYKIPEYSLAELDVQSQGVLPMVSGGRTALRVDESKVNEFVIEHAYPEGFGEAVLTNTQALHWADPNTDPGLIKRRYYSNYPPLRNAAQPGRYGTTGTPATMPSVNYGRYFLRHPGYDPRNWNWSLDFDTPLAINQKRVQALLHLELFCPSVAYTEINPDYTIVISGDDISSIEVNGRAVFSTTEPIAIRSERPLYETDGHPDIGGYASFRNVALGRRVAGRQNVAADTGYDDAATSQIHSGLVNMDLVSSFFNTVHNEPLIFSSGLITMRIYDRHVPATTSDEPVQTIQFRLAQGTAPVPDIVVVGSYNVNYVQSSGAIYNHPAIQAPRWWSFNRDGGVSRTDSSGNLYDLENTSNASLRSLRGRFYRWDGTNGARVDSSTRAYNPQNNTQRVPGAHALIYGKDASNYVDVLLQSNQVLMEHRGARIGYGSPTDPLTGSEGVTVTNPDWNRPWHYGSDTVRTLQPAHGDARLISIKSRVPAEDWTPHRLWNDANEFMAHNFSSYTAGTEPGFDRGTSTMSTAVDDTKRALPANVNLGPSTSVNLATAGTRSPDTPHGRSPFAPTSKAAHEFVQRYYDFDDSDPGGRVGPFINKVDEGNYAIGDYTLSGWPAAKRWRATYFRSDGQGARFANGSGSYFTPNRMVPSPVVMGSLPPRVWDSAGEGAWTNLLFRPYVALPTGATGSTSNPAAIHPGETSPPDHYLLDLFWMPVVEPYAISESLSTAGKINLNYQMLPFTHIRRATAVHAAMKGEIMSVIPNKDYGDSKTMARGWGLNGSTPPVFRSETMENKYWHRSIVVDRFKPETKLWWELNINERVQGTLRQFEERFNFGAGNTGALPDGYRGGLFRTASQLCEVHLIPSTVSNGENVNASQIGNYSARRDAMANFWGRHAGTGDNTKERPYANLYSKFTTRSNTFRVHVRAQSINKATRSVASDVFDPTKDQVGAEFRGSFLLERYIDQADLNTSEVDYAAAANPFQLKPLESYYRFRVIESKRFAP